MAKQTGKVRKTEATKPRTRRKSTVTAKSAAERAPSHEEIARRAFELFSARSGAEGDAMADWLSAEAQLMANAS